MADFVYVITRDGTEIMRGHSNDGKIHFDYVDEPSAGSHTYAIKIARYPIGSGSYTTGSVGDRSFTAILFKK